MKLIATLFTGMLSASLYAQNFLPEVYTAPLTGFEQLQQTHPYIVVFNAGNGTSQWIPQAKYTRAQAPNIDIQSQSQYWSWDTLQWALRESHNDSFVVDNNNKLISVISVNESLYPGYEQRYKSKYNLFYDTQNRINRYDYYSAQPATSNNFTRSSITFIKYNEAGNRITDSALYTYNGNTSLYLTRYFYSNNNLVQISYFSGGGDSTGKTVFAYHNHLLSSTTSYQFDPNSDEWAVNHSDTFEYNNKDLISERRSTGYVYNDGVLIVSPVRNESYTYTDDNQLLQMTDRLWRDGQWINWYQTRVNYDPNGKALEAYDYFALENGTWASAPSRQYVFAPTTSTPEINNAPLLVKTYPNPVNDELTAELENETFLLVISNIAGKVCYTETHYAKAIIDVSLLENGIYFLTVQAENGRQRTQKIVVNHR